MPAGCRPTPATRPSDGYELTFAVNYLAHAQLVGDLLGSFTGPARIVLLGSNIDADVILERWRYYDR